MSSNNELLRQLNALLRLTQTEIMIAETRRSQATSSDIERELAANADKGREHSGMLADAIRSLGGAPDVTGVFVGRLAASTKAMAEQGQDLVDALVGDLAVEHELLDRTRFAAMLAQQRQTRQLEPVLDRLEQAHTATIDWLMTRLGEVAVGGPVALRPSPAQAFAGFGRRVSTLPARRSARLLNRSVDRLARLRARASDTVAENVDRTRELVDAAGEVWTAGRDASLKRTEEIADQRGDRDTARRVNRARLDLGAVDSEELPIRHYDSLNAGSAIDRINKLTDPSDVRAVLAYETANKQRKGVTAAARERFEELASEVAAAS
jgi:bacterioferritin (cytochrome b1)